MYPANNQFPKDGKQRCLPAVLFIALTAALLIPFTGMYLFEHTLNPFDLKGKPFLLFYGILTAMIYGTAFSLRTIRQEQLKTSPWHAGNSMLSTGLNIGRWLVTATVLLGIARLVRGVYLGRPVIFLCLMLLAHAILCTAFFKADTPVRES